MKTINEIVDVLEKVCQRIAAHPLDIKIVCATTVHTANIRIYSHPEDTMKLVGKGGVTASAITDIVRLMADSIGIKLRLSIVPTDRVKPVLLPFASNQKYNADGDVKLLRRIMEMVCDDGITVKAIKVDDTPTFALVVGDVYWREGKDELQSLEESLCRVFWPMARNHGSNMYVEIDAMP